MPPAYLTPLSVGERTNQTAIGEAQLRHREILMGLFAERRCAMSRFPVLLLLAVLGALPLSAAAHTVVSPSESVSDRIETYWLRVPTEGDMTTVEVTLEVPAEVVVQRTLVKPGWTVTSVARPIPEGASDEMKESPPLASITWKGGSIPPGQFDQFGFSAINPAKPVTVSWKVTQKYQDGMVASWTGAPGSKTPAAQTKIAEKAAIDQVASDLATTRTALTQLQQSYSQLSTANAQSLQSASAASGPAYVGLALAVVALLVAALPLLRKKP